ncbi:MAG: hypothetical protein VXZ35_08245, partial [Pseudomonadota bacterium]|nr:hypothetical protein [Pseudomonadota bacterium]
MDTPTTFGTIFKLWELNTTGRITAAIASEFLSNRKRRLHDAHFENSYRGPRGQPVQPKARMLPRPNSSPTPGLGRPPSELPATLGEFSPVELAYYHEVDGGDVSNLDRCPGCEIAIIA